MFTPHHMHRYFLQWCIEQKLQDDKEAEIDIGIPARVHLTEDTNRGRQLVLSFPDQGSVDVEGGERAEK